MSDTPFEELMQILLESTREDNLTNGTNNQFQFDNWIRISASFLRLKLGHARTTFATSGK